MIDELAMVRCRNYEEEPEICDPECGIIVPALEMEDGRWITRVLDADPEWFIVLRACPDHDRHADPFCCINCFQRYHARHGHA